MKRFYVVATLRQWNSLEVLGLPLNAHQSPGCIGFLPVFDTREAAMAWRDEHAKTAGIEVIQEAGKPREAGVSPPQTASPETAGPDRLDTR